MGGGMFFFACRNSCLHSPFSSANNGKENKTIMTGLKEITGCHSSETHACVCREVKLECASMSVWMASAGEGGRVHTHVWHRRSWENHFLSCSLSNSLSRGTKQPLHGDRKKKKKHKQNRNIPNSWDLWTFMLKVLQCSSQRCTVTEPTWVNVQWTLTPSSEARRTTWLVTARPKNTHTCTHAYTHAHTHFVRHVQSGTLSVLYLDH